MKKIEDNKKKKKEGNGEPGFKERVPYRMKRGDDDDTPGWLRMRRPLWSTDLPPVNQFVPGTSPQISLFSTISVYGKRRTGKSQFLKWNMVEAYRHFIPWGWCFTETGFNGFYASFFPRSYIISEFNADVMQMIMDRQKAARGVAEDDQSFNPRIVVIWDDYSGQDIKFNGALHKYYFTGRHYLSLNYFCAQHITMTPPAIRSNTDMVVLFNTDYSDSLEHYWKDFAGKMDKDAFYRIFDSVVREEHCFIAIDNNPNTPYEKKFFKGKAELLPMEDKYIVGCQEFWEEDLEQLEEIGSGEMKRKDELAGEWADYSKSTQILKSEDHRFATGGINSSQIDKLKR